MDRRTRKELKTDKFAQEVEHSFEFLTEHRSQVIRYGSIVVVVAAIILGGYYYHQHQIMVRQDALNKALQINDAVVSATPKPPSLTYATQDAKDKAVTKAFTDVASMYHGTTEGAMAQLYLAGAAADKGKLDEAEKIYKDVADSAPDPYPSAAQFALAQIYAGQGKTADAEKLLRALIANPTVFVSKDEATLTLADMLVKSNPKEAQKLIDPLRQSNRATVSQAAITISGKLAQNEAN
jgi:predicted negative regulator of RcsB-dependent stress response